MNYLGICGTVMLNAFNYRGKFWSLFVACFVCVLRCVREVSRYLATSSEKRPRERCRRRFAGTLFTATKLETEENRKV